MIECVNQDKCKLVSLGLQSLVSHCSFKVCPFLIFPDGQQIWEMEATVDKDKSQPVSTWTR